MKSTYGWLLYNIHPTVLCDTAGIHIGIFLYCMKKQGKTNNIVIWSFRLYRTFLVLNDTLIKQFSTFYNTVQYILILNTHQFNTQYCIH